MSIHRNIYVRRHKTMYDDNISYLVKVSEFSYFFFLLYSRLVFISLSAICIRIQKLFGEQKISVEQISIWKRT